MPDAMRRVLNKTETNKQTKHCEERSNRSNTSVQKQKSEEHPLLIKENKHSPEHNWLYLNEVKHKACVLMQS